MLTWIALVLTFTSLLLVMERLVRHRPNGIALPPLIAAQILRLINGVKDSDTVTVGLAVFTLALCAGWAQALRVAHRRRRA